MRIQKIPNNTYMDIDYFEGAIFTISTTNSAGIYNGIQVRRWSSWDSWDVLFMEGITSHGFGRIKVPFALFRKEISDNNEEGRLIQLGTPTKVNLGRIWGNWPMCFDVERTRAYYQLWTSQHSSTIFYRRFDSLSDPVTTQQEGFATGLDRVQDGDIISWEENRFTEPDMQLPQRTKDYTIGEHFNNGIMGLYKPLDILKHFVTELTNAHDPRVVQVNNNAYISFWQGNDSYIMELTPADFQQVMPELKHPQVTVKTPEGPDRLGYDGLKNGQEIVFFDRENPDLGPYEVRVFIENGSIYCWITNNKGTGKTGMFRPVKLS